ncbi:MAG TPA: helix-turn-helix domain-containing protein, partial [Blastocatellia bacterium]|nr:helix-turn-helix domain-containing protein [Blastocatellia bacterium]
ELLSTDARIISATNKDLEREVESQRFRGDLFYRLCVVSIPLPPLRERKSDVPALAQAFCDRYAIAYRRSPLKISKDALKVLLDYDWPGNVRQLRNYIERAVVLAEGDKITLDVLPEDLNRKLQENKGRDLEMGVADRESINISPSLNFKDAKREFERKFIEKCLDSTSGNITQAASLLGMHRQSLQHKIKELGLTKKFIPDS